MKARFYVSYRSALAALLLLATILSASAGEILYQDNFTNLDPSWGTPSERLSVKDGKLTLKPAPNTTESILNQSNVFDDADIRVDVIVPAGDANVPGGLIFWARDRSNFYCLCIDAAGYFKISRYVTDRWLQPVGWIENAAISKGVGQLNKLRVVTKGRQATAYINDQQVTTFDGQPPQGGGCVGVSGGSPENTQNTWQFANLRVTATLTTAQPSSAAAQPSSPAVQSPSAPAHPSSPAAQSSSAAAQPSSPAAQPLPPSADLPRVPSPPKRTGGRVALRLHGS